MTPAGIRWAGSRARLIELGSLADVLALHAYLIDHPLPGQIDLIPAARTLLIACDSRRDAARVDTRVAAIDAPPLDARSGRALSIDVVYDGPDLDAVGRLTGLGAQGVIAAHTGQAWLGAFGGFAPGFVYLLGEDDTLEVARRDSPRTAVPAGAVAVAGRFAAVYPRRSPGGWQLIGRTDARVWDIAREQPALIQPGDRVRFTAVDALRDDPTDTSPSSQAAPFDTAGESALEIEDVGLQSLIEDLGRPGLSHMGVGAAGVADEAAARQANRLVGNAPGDAVIETTLGGLAVRARSDQVLAHTGACGAAAIDGPYGARSAPARAPFLLHHAETLTLAPPHDGLRGYLGVRGGIDVARVLGSRATDTLSGIGPAPLAAGHVLAVGASGPRHIVGAPEPSTLAAPAADGTVVLRAILGPRHDWFTATAHARLADRCWQATAQSNRIGVRLAPDTAGMDDRPPLERCRDGELDSEGAVAGAIQVPPSGLPVLFLADHPVTGGYPVIAVVVAGDLPRAAQLAPGDTLRFSIVDPDSDLPTAGDATP